MGFNFALVDCKQIGWLLLILSGRGLNEKVFVLSHDALFLSYESKNVGAQAALVLRLITAHMLLHSTLFYQTLARLNFT